MAENTAEQPDFSEGFPEYLGLVTKINGYSLHGTKEYTDFDVLEPKEFTIETQQQRSERLDRQTVVALLEPAAVKSMLSPSEAYQFLMNAYFKGISLTTSISRRTFPARLEDSIVGHLVGAFNTEHVDGDSPQQPVHCYELEILGGPEKGRKYIHFKE